MTKKENILNKIRTMNLMERNAQSAARIRANNSMMDRLQRMRSQELNRKLQREKEKAFLRLAEIDEYGEDFVEDDVFPPKEHKFNVWKR